MREPWRVVQMTTHHDRFWEIDLFRGCAVIMMVVFHLVFDLNFFSINSIPTSTGVWRWLALTTATLFLFLAGISLTISVARRNGESRWDRYRHSLYRGGGIFSIGVGITITTYLLLGEGFIIFGILHCIGISIILALPFLGYPQRALGVAALCFVGGFVVDQVNGPLWLAGIGVHPIPFYSVDYVPLLPWFGVFLLGVSIGTYLYPSGSRSIALSRPHNSIISFTNFLGRHSLAIYLIHQPVILMVLGLLFPGTIPWIK